MQFQKAENSGKNISSLDFHKKELFIVFFMLLLRAVKSVYNKLW